MVKIIQNELNQICFSYFLASGNYFIMYPKRFIAENKDLCLVMELKKGKTE